VLCVVAAALTACGSGPRRASHTIVVSSYPVQYVVRRLAGESADLRNLARPGVEPHDLELTSDDIDAIDDAQVVFYIGSGFQPAVAAAAKRRGDKAVDVSFGVISRKRDPHFWLDPTLMTYAATRVAPKLTLTDLTQQTTITRRMASLVDDLDQLDADYRAALSHCERKEIVTTHESFGYLAARYGLTELSISGSSPDTEPSPQRLSDLSATIRRDHITTVFYEPRVPRAAANTLANDAGVTTARLDPFESTNADYFTVMRANLAALKTALGCS
jgi:zinc transport system substrate-binding protein